MSTFRIIQNNKSSFVFLIVLVILPIIVSSSITFWAINHEALIKNFSLPEWSIFYLFSCITMAYAFTPTTFIALISGYFLGWESIFFIIPAYMLASFIGYKTAGLLDKGKFMNSIQEIEAVNNVMNNLKKDELNIIILSRLSPALPFAMMNVLLSYLKAGMKNFMLGSLIGMLPRTLVSIWIGMQASYISELFSNNEKGYEIKILIAVLLILSFAGLTYIISKALKVKTEQKRP